MNVYVGEGDSRSGNRKKRKHSWRRIRVVKREITMEENGYKLN